jgi:PBP1b-binding outer membrane lipoprotein LpoB
MKVLAIAAAATIMLAGCGNPAEQAKELQGKAEAAIDRTGLGEAARTVIDEKAVEGMIKGAASGAVNDAVREIVPAQELRAIGAVVDEQAVMQRVRRTMEETGLGDPREKALEGSAGEAQAGE